MSQSPLNRFLSVRGPILLGPRNAKTASAMAVRAYHVVVGAGAAVWIAGELQHYGYATAAGPALIATGILMRFFVRKMHDASATLVSYRVPLDPEVEGLLVRLVGAEPTWQRIWQRLTAPPTKPSRLDRALTPESRRWLEHGASATNRVLGTIERLGLDHPFTARNVLELERAVDYGMIQLMRCALQLDKYPETRGQISPIAERLIQRLDTLADLVDSFIRPNDTSVRTVSDPLQRAIEDLSLESLVQVKP